MSYNETIQDLETKLFSLHPKAKELYHLIAGLKNFTFDGVSPRQFSSPKLVFDKNDPVSKKIVFALKYINKVAKVGEIEKVIKEYEPTFNKGFSTALRVLKEDLAIDIYNPTGSNRDVYYGLSGWFDGKNVKSEFMPEEYDIL